MLDSLSDTTINLCGKILLKLVKMHFSWKTEFFFFFFLKTSNFFTGFRIHFFLKIGTLEMVKNRLAKNESEI